MWFNYLYSLCMAGTGSSTETPTRRYRTAVGGLTDRAPGEVTTVYGAFEHRLRLEPQKQTMGRRRLRAIHQRADGAGRTRQYFELGEYEWVTYEEIGCMTRELGAGLWRRCEGNRVAIYAPTSREWTLTMLACYSQAMQVVTAYDTLGDDGLVHAVTEADARTLVVRVDQLPTVARVCDRLDKLSLVVYFGEGEWGSLDEAARRQIEELVGAGNVVTLDSVAGVGREYPRAVHKAAGSDPALVMYTSGTTGAPRGVVVAHGALLSVCGAIHELVPAGIDFVRDRVLSYLPLAHVLAFFVETYCLYSGIAIGYGSPRTLTEEYVVGGLGDIRTLRPAVMLGVPQVWNAVHAGIARQVAQRPEAVQRLFYGAVALKTWLVGWGLPTWLLDKVVFRRTRAGTGGLLKLAITGGAPINRDVQRLIAASVCPMIQGYGLTEAAGLVSVQIPGDTTLGNIGTPVPSVEMKLVDVPEAGYFARDNRGEVCVRGPSVFHGYLNDEVATKDVLDSDGWLRTGDIGQWIGGGRLAVIDRRSNLVKLACGEYIALEALEAAYSSSRYIANICVVADSHARRPCALVNVDPKRVAEAGVAAEPVDQSLELRALVLADLAAAAARAGLAAHETLCDVRIDPELWTPENGMLTAASKLRRAVIRKQNDVNLGNMLASAR
ncbi:long-chain fatty acid-CoA ligase [Coemansia sp. RSA 552]|nr:long-chain fatty acid-CoA ligase [Coemansia sp. RSA 552]